MSPQWVLRDGVPFARALVLSHSHQLDQLAATAPAALPAAVVAGDPCFDRIVASLPFRARYRQALGIGDRTLIYVSSTWSTDSTIGARFDLVRELLAELPRDTYAVAMALHPNISHRHGPGHIPLWFADCLRAGLILLPEMDGWRTGLIAADLILGDNGSVTGYGAALGRPTVIAAFPDVPAGTAISELGRAAHRLPAHGPYRRHLDAALAEHTDDRFAAVTALVTSEPGRALPLLRTLFYRILDLPEPNTEPPLAILPVPERPGVPGPHADLVTTVVEGARIRMARRPAEVQRAPADDLGTAGRHLCCDTDYPLRSLRANADVLLGLAADTAGAPAAWSAALFDRHPLCAVAAVAVGDTCLAATRDGVTVEITGGPADIAASAFHAWREAGNPVPPEPTSLTVGLGAVEYDLVLRSVP